MTKVALPYPEKRLQVAALAWAQDHIGYRQIADDVEATGDRMDAIGLIDDELLIIETKVNIHEGIVGFDPAKSGTIEPKIAGTLRPLYGGERRGQPGIIARHWDGRTPPTIGVLAASYSEAGLTTLVDMLDERARDWRFSYRVWRWIGDGIEELAHMALNAVAPHRDLSTIQIPSMVSHPAKRPTATWEELRGKAVEHGISETFDDIVDRARRLRLGFRRRVLGLNVYTAGPRQVLWCSIFVTDADVATGINCGIDAALYGAAGLALPGVEAPRSGFMNTNRFIRSRTDVGALFAPFTCGRRHYDGKYTR